MKLVGKLAVNVLALFVVSYIIPGFVIIDIWAAVVAAIVIGVVNTYIRPVLQIVAFPITILTFGVAALLINVCLLYFVAKIVPGFNINNFSTAVIASITLSLTSWFLHRLAKDDKKPKRRWFKNRGSELCK